MNVVEICDGMERYFAVIRGAQIDKLWLRDRVVRSHEESELGELARRLESEIPDDVLTFLWRGVCAAEGSIDAGDDQASIGFDFLNADAIASHTEMLRNIAKGFVDDDEHPCQPHAVLVLRGLAITYEEPNLVVAADGVYHFSFRNPLVRVAPTFAHFLEHYLASGCFKAGRIAPTSVLAPYVPITVERNTWLEAYRSYLGAYA